MLALSRLVQFAIKSYKALDGIVDHRPWQQSGPVFHQILEHCETLQCRSALAVRGVQPFAADACAASARAAWSGARCKLPMVTPARWTRLHAAGWVATGSGARGCAGATAPCGGTARQRSSVSCVPQVPADSARGKLRRADASLRARMAALPFRRTGARDVFRRTYARDVF